MKDYEDEAFDDLERAQGWRKRQIADAQKFVTEREALKLALEALEEPKEHIAKHRRLDAITAIKEALAQPEQKPVVHTLNCVCGAVWDIKTDESEEMVHTPDTTPPQLKPLTDEDLRRLADKYLYYQPEGYVVSGVFDFARAIEAKLKQQRTWVGLTPEEREDIVLDSKTNGEMLKSLEAKLKEKNT